MESGFSACDQNNDDGLDIVVEPESELIKVGTTTAPLKHKAGEDIQLSIFY